MRDYRLPIGMCAICGYILPLKPFRGRNAKTVRAIALPEPICKKCKKKQTDEPRQK